MDYELTRRAFLEISATAGVGLLTQGAFARDLTVDERRTLLAIARALFPRRGVPDAIYVSVVDSVERSCSADDGLFAIITRGLAVLERACPGGFANIPAEAAVRLLEQVDDTPFFAAVYAETLEGLCGSPGAWAMFTGITT
jgi:hypothetical protein